MIIVHHLNNSRSQRILWLLEELGLEYEIKKYQRDPKTMLAPPELRAVHPLGKSPVIQDGDTIVAESGAIIEYLAGRYGDGRLLPVPGTPERAGCAVSEADGLPRTHPCAPRLPPRARTGRQVRFREVSLWQSCWPSTA
jgi:glutathione S-transferase